MAFAAGKQYVLRRRPQCTPTPRHPRPSAKSARPKEQPTKVPMPPLDVPFNPLNNPRNVFKCAIKFRNDLPDVPVDPKILVPPLHPEQLSAFQLTSLEREMRQELHTLPGLGIPVTVLNTHNYRVPAKPPALHPDDEALLAGAGQLVKQPGGRTGHGAPPGPSRQRMAGDVSWLMRTTYISNDASTKKAAEATRGGHVRTSADAELEAELNDARTQIKAIERSFEVCQQPPVHPTNPSLRPVAALPLLPDLDMARSQHIDITFDDDPAVDLAAGNLARGRELVGRSMLTLQLYDMENKPTPYVAILTPKNPEPDQRPLPRTEEFTYHREYRYNIKADHRFGANYAIRLTSDSATYVDINTKLDLKRPGAEDRVELRNDVAVPERVLVRKRHLIEEDVEQQRKIIRTIMGNDEELMAHVLRRNGKVYADGEEDGEDEEPEREPSPVLDADDSGEDEPGEQAGGADRSRVAELEDDDDL